jgi:class 3 adenylate cyclase
MLPRTRYAKSGDVHIAYQVIGEGPIDLVLVPGFISNVELLWDWPPLAHLLNRLAGFSRLILFDKRGTGLSDRIGGVAPLEQRMDDVRAVMDAVGSERAALFGISEGGAMSTLFAATYPDRTRALVLYGTYASYTEWVLSSDKLAAFIAEIESSWGTGTSLRHFAPDAAGDRAFRDWWARFERLGASPQAVIDLTRMNLEIDTRAILPTIRVPTLIIHRAGDVRVAVEAGRYQAAHIPGATYVELPGRDHIVWVGDGDAAIDAVERFLTGSVAAVEPDRVLATVMFTDIVESTRRAGDLGDREWSQLLDRHRALARREFARFRGREVQSTGDGFLVTFDGPARAIRCAEAVRNAVRPLGLDLRIGLHTGEIVVAGNDISGIAVHLAARVAGAARAGEVLVSSTVKDLVAGSGIRFADRGSHALKGFEGEMRLYGVESGAAPAA